MRRFSTALFLSVALFAGTASAAPVPPPGQVISGWDPATGVHQILTDLLGHLLAFVTGPTAQGTSANPNPVILGGRDNGGVLRTVQTDNTGRVLIVGSGVGGTVFGPDAIGVAPTEPPVFIGGIGADGFLHAIKTDNSGNANVNVLGTVPVSIAASVGVTGTFWQATQPVSGTFWQATQPVSGTFWQATQPVSIASIPLPSGAATAAKQPALGTGGSPSSDVLTTQGCSTCTTTPVALAPSAASTYAITPIVSAAVESNHILKASAGNLYRIEVTTGATSGYLMIFNATTAPADGGVTPKLCRAVPANTSLEVDHSTLPQAYSTGMTVVFSSTGCFTKTASATAMFEGDIQ